MQGVQLAAESRSLVSAAQEHQVVLRRVLRGRKTVSFRTVIALLHRLTLFLCRLYLCNVVRHPRYGDSATCFQIWHSQWECGADLPALAKSKKIQMRKPGKKRARRPILAEDDENE